MKKSCLFILPVFLFLLSSCVLNQNTAEEPATLKSVEVTKLPDKTEYYEGEKFDPAGMELTAAFSDGSKKIVTDYVFEPDGALTLQNTKISVTYTYEGVSKSVVVEITVKQSAVLTEIYVKNPPEKTEYNEGDVFDTTGLVIYGQYSDGTEKEVSDYNFSPDAALSTSDSKITISYSENDVTKTAEITISVKAIPVTLESIEVTNQPDKTVYTEGEKFDKSGMVVTAYYSDGSSKEVSGYTYSPKDVLSVDDTQIEISYSVGSITKTVSISITVKEKISTDFDYESARANYGDFEISGGEYSTDGDVITLTPSEQKTEYVISGYFKGQLVNNTKNTIITFNNAFVENTSGLPAIVSTKKLEISMKKETVNYIVSSGASTEKTGAVYCYDPEDEKSKDLELGGAGTGYIAGNIYHGVKADEVKVKGNGKYYIKGTAKGASINCKTFLIEEEKSVCLYLINGKNGIKADENITVSSGSLYFDSVATCLKTDLLEDDSADNQKDHFIKLSNCSIFYKNINDLYKTEENCYSETDVTKEEF